MQIKKIVIGIAAFAVVAVFVLILTAPKAYCTQIYIDVNSGDIAKHNYIMFFRASNTVEATKFSTAAREASAITNTSEREWKLVEMRDTLFHKVYIYNEWHGSISACDRFAKWLETNTVSSSDQQELLRQAIAQLRNGEIDELENIK